MFGIILAIILSIGALVISKKITGRIILLALIWGIYFFLFRAPSSGELNKTLTISKGESIKSVANDLGKLKSAFISEAKKENANIKPGDYILSGTYSAKDLVQMFVKGPEVKEVKVTILEGRSIYDTDQYLAQKSLIKTGDYINYVTNVDTIKTLQEKYKSIYQIPDLSTLEGYLYPDTYSIDTTKPVVEKLVQYQLDQFENKLVGDDKIAGSNGNFDELRQKITDNYGIKLSKYDITKLASIIQKEESNKTNIPTVAGIFFNRLKTNDFLGADITLCYAFKDPYSSCLSHVNNYITQDIPYNTRKNKGLTPTPISNVEISTYEGVNNFQKTDYMFYLHDKDGVIHYATTNAQQNANRATYLQ